MLPKPTAFLKLFVVLGLTLLFISLGFLILTNPLKEAGEVAPPKKLNQGTPSKKPVLGTVTASLPVLDDSYIDTERPNQVNGAEPFLRVEMQHQQVPREIKIKRSLLKFDVSKIPAGSIVNSASIILYLSACEGNPPENNLFVKKVVDSWSESTVTWNNKPNESNPITSSPTDCASNPQSFTVATDLVQEWINGGNNFGVYLMNDPVTTNYRREYCSKETGLVSICQAKREPKLEITYIPPTMPPKPTVSISANPSTITLGQSSTLSWSSTNAERVYIEPGIGEVGPNGSRQVSPTISTIYTATAYGPGGTSDPKSVLITVNSPPQSGETQPKSKPSQSGDRTQPSHGPVQVSVITQEILNTQENIVVEHDIPVSIPYIDPNIFLRGRNVKITNVSNINKNGKRLLRFEGWAKPKTLVTLYISSNPVIVTVNSGTSGYWYYDREKNIEAGKHTAFATIYDEGVTRRSNVVNFFIAKTASGSGSLVIQNPNLKRLLPYALALGGSIVTASLILVMYRIYIRRKATTV